MMIIKSKCQSSTVPTVELESAEASPRERREMREVTVRVCLRRVFGSRRARVLLRVRCDLPARHLAQRLQDLFPAGGPEAAHTALVTAGSVLPPNEPLAVLAPGDLVEAIPLHKDYGDEDEREFYKKIMSAFMGVPTFQQECVRTEPQNCDETPIDLVPCLENDKIQPNFEHESSEDLLHEMKRQALLLLEEYGENIAPPHVAGTEERSKRRRRRVRRRRPVSSLSPSSVGVATLEVQSPVQQNVGATTRTPRCVRAGSSTADMNRLYNAH